MNTRSLKLVNSDIYCLLNYVYIALNHRINNHQITLRYLRGFDLLLSILSMSLSEVAMKYGLGD